MVPKLHDKGCSFKGIAAYLLHDKNRAQTSERVAWTDTRNLATDDADLAWRIQAATSMDQDRLKRDAGVRKSGRKSDKHVLHFTLSWHPDEDPTREEMSEAADEAIAALGASDRQVLLVVHNDEEHVHIHGVINRVSPTDGRLLSSSKEKLKLSQWAQNYEEQRTVYCHNRVVNNAERARKMAKPKHKRGSFVRYPKDTARHLLETPRQRAANDNDAIAALQAAEKAKDHTLALRGRNLAKQQADAWKRLSDAYIARRDALARKLQSQLAAAEKTALEAHRASWVTLNQRQVAEKQTFEALEKKFFGRLGNAIKVTRRAVIEGDTTGMIKRAFNILHDASRRWAFFDEAQKRQRDTLTRQQDAHVHAISAPHKAVYEAKSDKIRQHYLNERETLAQHQVAQQQVLQKDWHQRTQVRKKAFAVIERYRAHLQAGKVRDQLKPPFDQASFPAPANQNTEDQWGPDLTSLHSPSTGSGETTQQNRPSSRIEAFRKALQRPDRDQDNERER